MNSAFRPSVASVQHIFESLQKSITDHAAISSQPDASPASIDQAERQIAKMASTLANHTQDVMTTITTIPILPLQNTAVQIALNLGIPEHLVSYPGSTVDSITKTTGAHPYLVLRIVRCLASVGYISESASQNPDNTTHGEVQPGVIYGPNRVTAALTNPLLKAWTKMIHDSMSSRWFSLPSYLASPGRASRPNINGQEFCDEYFGGQSFWDRLKANPEEAKLFNTAMQAQTLRSEYFKAAFPFAEQIKIKTKASTSDANSVTIVDVGGGHGGAVKEIVENNPGLPGRLVVQDLESVISSLRTSAEKAGETLPFEAVAHDFFQPQSLDTRGARWYYLRAILHDWDDEHCITILSHIRDAIVDTCEYSSVLIHERVMPDMDCDPFDALQDITMMPLGGMERNEAQWRKLLEKSALKLKTTWRAKAGTRHIMEAVIA